MLTVIGGSQAMRQQARALCPHPRVGEPLLRERLSQQPDRHTSAAGGGGGIEAVADDGLDEPVHA